MVHQLQVTLDELYNGATRKLSLQKNVICDKCEGRGGKKGAVETCPNCRGSGMQIRVQQLGPGFVQQIQSMCEECRGQGERINPRDRCKQCSGKKVGPPPPPFGSVPGSICVWMFGWDRHPGLLGEL